MDRPSRYLARMVAVTVTDRLFSPDYDQPVDTRTQVDRMPGTPDAACMCGREECRWPFDAGCWPDHHNDEEAA